MSLQKINIISAIIVLMTSSFNREVFAQKLTELTPPSPTAYELGRYGQTPVGLFSGTSILLFRSMNFEQKIFLSLSL